MGPILNNLSDKNIAIRVDSISKVYPLFDKSSDRLKEALHPLRKKYHKDFYALNEITFQVNKGDSLGIIGQNGSGKSTLLKILSRVITPTKGSFDIKGRVISLLELGSGFNPELTGLENIYFYGTILGFSKKMIEKKLDEIISFADIGVHLHQSLKTYSSGMRSRLAFSVASHVDPDILILDEVLAVGDIRFKQKCYRVMRDIIDQKKTVLLVTHSMNSVTSYCNKALWLNEGKIQEYGLSSEVVKRYVGFMTYGLESKTIVKDDDDEDYERNDKNKLKGKDTLSIDEIQWKSTSKLESFGERGGTIEKIALYFRDTCEQVKTLKGGEWLTLYTKIKVNQDFESPGLGVRILDKLGNAVFTVNNYIYNKPLGFFKSGEKFVIRTDFKFPLLRRGKYISTISLSEGNQEEHVQHHWIHDAIIIQVQNEDPKFKRNLLVLDNSDYDIKLIKHKDILSQ